LPIEKKSEHGTTRQPIGEVISSSITGLQAEARQVESSDGLPLTVTPTFGSFICSESSEQALKIVAVVYDVVTGPGDSFHRTAALGLTREQLKVEQPHIFALLRTEIQALTVGYFSNSTYFSHLPPQPAQVHDFILRANEAEIRAATEDLDFLRLLTGVSTVPADELIAAAIRQAYSARGNDYQFLVRAGQALSQLFEDYERLVAVLKKVKPTDSSVRPI
jgi:hypothetical protein